MVRGVLLAVLAATVVTACSSGTPGAAPPTSTRVAAGTTTAVPCPAFRGSTTELTSVGKTVPAFLVDATAGEEGCLDVVTFTFRSTGDGTPPGYMVGYVDPAQHPFLDGNPPVPVSLPGVAFLLVTIRPAHSRDATQPNDPQTYLGNLSLRYGDHHHLVIVRELPDGPDSVVWAIGLDAREPFLVDRSQNPTRVTVYIG